VCVNCGAVFLYKNKRYDRQGLCTNLPRSTITISSFLTEEWPRINVAPALKKKFICKNCIQLLASINVATDKLKGAKRKFENTREGGVLWPNAQVVGLTSPVKKYRLIL